MADTGSKSPVRAVAERERAGNSGENSPLVPSEGVGSGGAGHIPQGSAITFRLPPPIPGKPGGGYPQEYHDAANLIKRNYKVFAERKKAQMQEVTLDGDGSGGDANPSRSKKIFGGAAALVGGIVGKATGKVTEVTSGLVAGAQTYTSKLKAAVARPKAEEGELSTERKEKYAGWIMERIKTKGPVGFFLARSTTEKPFAVAVKQEKIQVMDIPARRDLKTTYVVQPGNVLNWTFAVQSHDIKFHVLIRKMKETGGADDEELVPVMKVDSNSMGEGTYTVEEGGQAVLLWDNSYSLMRSKTIAYRAWVEKERVEKETTAEGKSAEAEEQPNAAAAVSTPQEKKEDLSEGVELKEMDSEGKETGKEEDEAAAKQKAADEQAAEAKKVEEEAAKKKAEEEAAVAKKKEEEEAAAKKEEEEEAAAKKKKEEEEAAKKKKEEEEAAAAKKAAEEEAAKKKKQEEEEAAKKKKAEEEEAAKKKAEEEAAAAKKKEEEEAAAKKKAEEEEAAKKKAEEEAAAQKKKEEEEAAKKKAEEEAAAAKKKAEEEEAARKKAAEEEAAKKKAEEEAAAAKKKEEEEAAAKKKAEEE
eukprot:CAMPEP_0181303058 /NCGR_PEP_ID=MMETSP1101-20121128/8343_1 /TAXON_ID=46948 /ORGANISM="Rhodomonas abbreviata, Strain Caron Lab Isolate" /LENGTH=584 /DNA_ID=CAMNT_0023408581 /DNA_START=34 /DNA_END=1785 /DNA_ORIENTATION=+